MNKQTLKSGTTVSASSLILRALVQDNTHYCLLFYLTVLCNLITVLLCTVLNCLCLQSPILNAEHVSDIVERQINSIQGHNNKYFKTSACENMQ